MGKAVLVHVGGVDNGLQGQQVAGGDQGLVVIGAVKGAGRLAAVQMRRQRLEHIHLVEEFLVPLGGLLGLVHPALHHVQIRHDELHVNGLNVPHGIHRHIGTGVRHHMHDVLIVKAADNVDNGVGLPDVGQELVAQARPLAGPLHQSGNVHELDDGRGLFVRLIDLCQLVQPCIRHCYHAHVGVNGAEGVVGALGTGVGDGVEQGGLANIRQSHDT